MTTMEKAVILGIFKAKQEKVKYLRCVKYEELESIRVPIFLSYGWRI